MFSIRLKFAFRSLMKNKTYTMLNIAGLAIGLAVSIIIFLYLRSELSYDTSVPDHNRIYRIESQFELDGKKERLAGTSQGLGPMLHQEFDYIENYTRLYHIEENVLFKNERHRFYEENIAIADSNFFQVFNLPFIYGEAGKSLNDPYTMVVTRSFAHKYFGNQNPVGQILSTNNHNYTITGLIDNLPANTHHRFDAVLSAFYDPVSREDRLKSLWQANVFTFLKFKDPQDADRLLADFDDFYEKYMQPVGEKLGGNFEIILTRLDKVHFGEKFKYDLPEGDKAYLYAFAAIGILILLLACINYVNMATARSMRRAKEAGMRKILGSSKDEIRLLIFSESIILSLLSLFLAFVLVELVLELTPFNEVLGKDLALDFQRFPALWWLPLSLALIVGIASGWYPALNLSKVPGLAAIQGGYRMGKRSTHLRRFLVGFQFCISVAVVITALGMYRQMEFVRNKDLGFNKEDVLLVPIPESDTLLLKRIPNIQQQLQNTPYVISASTAISVPRGNLDRSLLNIENADDTSYSRSVMDMMQVGLNYFKTMEIKVVEGRDFKSSDMDSDPRPIVVNQQLVDEMGWENAIGKTIKWGFDESGNPLYEGRVIGVVHNFNSHSLHDPIEPTVIFLQNENIGTMHVRLDSEHLMEAMNDVEEIWSKADPKNPFQFSFLNKDLMNLYQEEQRQSRLILYLTYLAIFISFLGLTGLASFTTGLRTREIGIRKVLGADVFQMVNLIFKDMLRLIVISVVLAVPLAWLMIKAWLSGFAYSATMDPFIFAFSTTLAVLLAYLIVTYHSLRVARSNPVDTLKFE